MSFGGNSLEEGYNALLPQQVVKWLVNLPQVKTLINSSLEETGVERLSSLLSKSLGDLSAGHGLFQIGEGRIQNSELMFNLQKIVDENGFLSRQNVLIVNPKSVTCYLNEKQFIAFGKAVKNSSWWVSNLKEIKRAIRDIKVITEIHNS